VINGIRDDDEFGVITIVTPTLQSAYYLRRSLAAEGLFNTNFLRLEDVAEQISAGVTTGEPLTDIQASEYVYQVALDSSIGTLVGGERYSPQLQAALHSTFRQMERLDESQLDRLGSANPNQNELVKRFTAYKKLTSNRKYGGEIARQAAEIVSKDDAVGFHSVTALGTVILVKAAPVQFELQVLFDALSERDNNMTVIVDESPSLHGSDDESISTFTVPTVADEIREVIRQIVQLARDNESLTRTAVLFEDDSYANRITESLQAVGINVSGPDRITLKDAPEGRFILGLLNVFDSDFDRLAVTAWFSSSPIGDPSHGGQPIPSARWDAISRSAGVVRSVKNSWSLRLERYQQKIVVDAETSERRGELSDDGITAAVSESKYTQQLNQFIQSLASRELPDKQLTWIDFVDWLNQLINDYLITDESGRERLSKLLKRLISLDSTGVKPSVSHCIDVLREQLDRKNAGIRSLGAGVYVGPLWTAVACPFDQVFILGMTEGSYPTIPRTDPLIPDHVKIDVDPERLVARSRSIADSKEQFQSMFVSAGKVRLFWPRTLPGQAQQMGPARWFVEVLQRLSHSEFIAVNQLLNHQVPELKEIQVNALPPEIAGGESELGVLGALEWVEDERSSQEFPLLKSNDDLQRSLKFQSERFSSSWTEYDGNLRPEGGSESSGSATAFETYATCPYKYFVSKKLKVQPTKSPEELTKLDPLTFGTLIHEVLERFSKDRLTQVDRSLTPEEDRGKLLDELNKHIEKLKDEMPGRSHGMWDLEFSRAWSMLQRWFRDDSEMLSRGMVQKYAELQFGYGNKPPVELMLDSGETIRFRGQIDRIDVSDDETRVHVYDYKSGSSKSYESLDRDPVNKGGMIQLPLYSEAARRLYPDADMSAAYWFVKEPDKKDRLLPPTDKYDETKARHRLKSVVKVIADGVRSGTFPADPGERNWRPGVGQTYENCAYCEFKKICPENKAFLWSKKKHSDPALSDYVALTENEVDYKDG
jgi:hypothetical protein